MELPERPVNPTPNDELAALYALDILDADDVEQVNQTAAKDDSFMQQVSEFQTTAAALAYAQPTIPMAEDAAQALKARLFERIAQEDEAQPSPLLELLKRSIQELKQQSTELDWQPMGRSLAEIAVWQTDEASREVAFFVRQSEAGLFPNHAHAGGETVLVLEGDFIANGEVYRVGDVACSMANTAHQPLTHQGCLLFCVSSMDDEILS